MVWRKTKSILTTFCHQTGLHGFGFIVQSPHWSQAGLYGVLILLAFAMMSRDAIFLFRKYNSEPTQVNLMVMHNDTFNLGQPTVCFLPFTYDSTMNPLPFSSYDSTQYRLSSEQTHLEFTADLKETLEELDTVLAEVNYNISKLGDKIKQMDKLSQINWLLSDQNAPFIALLHHTLAVLLSRENQLLTKTHPTDIHLSIDETEIIRQYLLAKKIDFKELSHFLSLVACLRVDFRYQIFYKSGQYNDRYNLCTTEKPTYIGLTDVSAVYDNYPKICYKLPDRIEFQTSLEFLEVGVNYIPNGIHVSPYECAILLDLSGRRGYFHTFSEASAINICNVQQTVKVSITNDVLSYSSAKKICKDYDRLDCLLECHQEIFLSNCKCFPLSLTTANDTKNPSIPYCSSLELMNLSSPLSQPHKILRKYCKTADNNIERCQSACPNECRTRQLNFNFGQIAHEFGNYQMKSKIIISTFVYPYFVESLYLNWSDVLMAFGGSIGFWLGASIIAFAHAVIFFVGSLLFNLVQEKKVNPVKTVKTVSLPGGYPSLKDEHL